MIKSYAELNPLFPHALCFFALQGKKISETGKKEKKNSSNSITQNRRIIIQNPEKEKKKIL
jgi:hypothetical protein